MVDSPPDPATCSKDASRAVPVEPLAQLAMVGKEHLFFYMASGANGAWRTS